MGNPPSEAEKNPQHVRPARGREVNRRIAGGDLQRIVAQIRLVRRVYGVGALSTGILAGVVCLSLSEPNIELWSALVSIALLCLLVSVQVLGALQLARSPKRWAWGLAGLQTGFYLLWLSLGNNSSTQLIWMALFWLAVAPMGRAQVFQGKHADLYGARLLRGRYTSAPWPSALLVCVLTSAGLALLVWLLGLAL